MTTPTDEDLSRLLEQTASSYDVPEHGPNDILAALAEQPRRNLRRRWLPLTAAAALAVLAGGLAFTGSASDSKVRPSSQASGGVDLSAPESAPQPVQDFNSPQVEKSAPLRSFSEQGTSVGTSANALRAPSDQGQVGGAGGGGTTAGTVEADGAEARVVTTGSISLVVKDKRVRPTLDAVQQAATAAGGSVASATSDEASDNPSGQVTLRVPAARYDSVVAQIRRLDAEVLSAETSARDVTAQYADLETQLRTLRAARERFLDLLARTRTVGEVLSVQQRVDEVTGRIDRIEGQRRLLANQSELSTLTVSVSAEGDPVTTQRSGLSQALRDAKDGFVSGVEALVRNSGRALLLALCLAVAFAVGRVLWRVARRRLV